MRRFLLAIDKAWFSVYDLVFMCLTVIAFITVSIWTGLILIGVWLATSFAIGFLLERTREE
jgi:general stress protein CsbA